MPQGITKINKAGGQSARANNKSGKRTKPGPRVIAPKKARVLQVQKIIKKNAAGLTEKIEKQLATRAGYTEMVGGKGGVRREKGGKSGGHDKKSRK